MPENAVSSPRIVVGVDGSANAIAALEWAVRAAGSWQAEVEAIYAWKLPTLAYGAPGGYLPADPKLFEEAAAEILRGAEQSVTTGHVKVLASAVEGYPADVLRRAAQEPMVIATVVGARGHSRLTSLVLGSVSHSLTHYMVNPLVIVPAGWRPPSASDRRIVVGVDGSPSSAHALRWAMAHAAATGADIDAVMVWPVLDPLLPARVPLEAIEAADRHNSVEGKVLDLLREVEHDGVRSRCEVITGRPAEVLLDRASDADLLVVGTRGHGRARELLTGSVSHACTHQNGVPVAVIPDPDR